MCKKIQGMSVSNDYLDLLACYHVTELQCKGLGLQIISANDSTSDEKVIYSNDKVMKSYNQLVAEQEASLKSTKR